MGLELEITMVVDLALLHPISVIDTFTKWGIDYMLCHPTSIVGHNYIIVAIDYFTKWEKVMPTY